MVKIIKLPRTVDAEARWQQAQKYEKNWWAGRVDAFNLEFYKYFADQVISKLSGVLDIQEDTTILEIGSGAAGNLTFLPSDKKYAIDPLEEFYSSIKKFAAFRDRRVKYLAGKGENLPFKDSFFSLIIMENVLDHCECPERIFAEIKRVLTYNGVIFLRQNTYHVWGKFIRNIMELFGIDKGHPYTFTKRGLENYFNRFGLSIINFEHDGYWKTWRKEIFSSRLKEFFKALLLATRDRTIYILKNE